MTGLEKAALALIEREARKLAKRLGGDQPDVGHWAGTYTLTPQDKAKRIYTFTNNPEDPLRFCHNSGYAFRPADTLTTDLGSIPWVFQGFPRKYLRLRPDDFPEAYIGHDAGCANRWLLVSKDSGPWRKMSVTLKQIDVMLFWFLTAESPTNGNEATRAECQAVYRAVRMFHSVVR